MKNKKSLLTISTIGAFLSVISFALLVTVITGTILIILDAFQAFWVPILISFSIIFLVMCAINVFLYSIVILNKRDLIQKDENEFAFWISAFAFWIIPIFSWLTFIVLYFKETKGTI